jgi:hypothetical protein
MALTHSYVIPSLRSVDLAPLSASQLWSKTRSVSDFELDALLSHKLSYGGRLPAVLLISSSAYLKRSRLYRNFRQLSLPAMGDAKVATTNEVSGMHFEATNQGRRAATETLTST